MGKQGVKHVLDALLIVFLNLFVGSFQGNACLCPCKPFTFFGVVFCWGRHFPHPDSDGFGVSVAFRDSVQKFRKLKPMQFVLPQVNPVNLTERRPDQVRVLFKTCDPLPVILWRFREKKFPHRRKRPGNRSFANAFRRNPFLCVRHQVIPGKRFHQPQDVPEVQIKAHLFSPDHDKVRKAFKQFHFLFFCALLISFERRFAKY